MPRSFRRPSSVGLIGGHRTRAIAGRREPLDQLALGLFREWVQGHLLAGATDAPHQDPRTPRLPSRSGRAARAAAGGGPPGARSPSRRQSPSAGRRGRAPRLPGAARVTPAARRHRGRSPPRLPARFPRARGLPSPRPQPGRAPASGWRGWSGGWSVRSHQAHPARKPRRHGPWDEAQGEWRASREGTALFGSRSDPTDAHQPRSKVRRAPT